MRNTHNITPKEYNRIHNWLRTNFGKPTKCESKQCKGISKRIEWALKQGCKYTTDRNAFIQLCKSCHTRYDMTQETKYKIGLSKKGKKYTEEELKSYYIPILQFDLSGNFIKRFESTKSASIEIGIDSGCICNALKGRSHTSAGFIWKYER